MTRLSVLLCLGVLAAACSAAPGTSIPNDGPLASTAGQALSQICDSTSTTSIGSVADQLRSVDGTGDASAVVSSLDTLMTNLESADVGQAAQALKDSALTQLRQAETALADPATAGQTASAAADALDGLESSIC